MDSTWELLRKVLVLAYLDRDDYEDHDLADALREENWDWVMRWLLFACDPACQFGRGSNRTAAKLYELEVREIREADQFGESLRSLAESYSVSTTTIYSIVCGDTWTHLPVLRPRPWLDDPVGYAMSLCD